MLSRKKTMQKCKKCPGIKMLNSLLSQLQGQGWVRVQGQVVKQKSVLYCDASNIASEQWNVFVAREKNEKGC